MTTKTIKIVHTADWHLGAPFAFLPPDIAATKRQRLRQSITALVDETIHRRMDLFLIAGDVFDQKKPPRTEIMFFRAALERLQSAGVQVVICSGNHDPAAADEPWMGEAYWPVAELFTRAEWRRATLSHVDLDIVGHGFAHANSHERIFSHVIMENRPTLLIAHAGWQQFEHLKDRYYPFDVDELARVRAHYIALGHYHRYTEVIPGRAYYSGTLEGLDFSSPEQGERVAIFLKLSGSGTVEVEPWKSPSLEMRGALLDVSAMTLEALQKQLEPLLDPGILLQVQLTGLALPALLADLPDLRRYLSEHCLYAELRQDKLIGVDLDQTFESNTYQGLFYQTMKAQIETAAPEDRQVLIDALAIGLSAFEAD